MKTLGVIVTIVSVGVILFAACGLRVLNGSGQVVTEERNVSDFTAVDLAGAGELTIIQDGSESLTVEADDNLLSQIKTEVRQGVLIIGVEDNFSRPILNPTGTIRYTLHVKTLTGIALSGAGTIEADAVEGDELSLENSGAGEISLDQVSADNLSVELSGAGNVEVAGEVTNQSIEISGFGSYEAGNLASQTATVKLSGAGSATIWVNEQLDSSISGVGSVNYYGSPRTNAKSSGIGTLKSLGDK